MYVRQSNPRNFHALVVEPPGTLTATTERDA
jgi:hypothetical protein